MYSLLFHRKNLKGYRRFESDPQPTRSDLGGGTRVLLGWRYDFRSTGYLIFLTTCCLCFMVRPSGLYTVYVIPAFS